MQQILKQPSAKSLSLECGPTSFTKMRWNIFFISKREETRDTSQLYLEGESLKALEEIYKTLIPFHKCAEEFYQTRSKTAFKSSLFYDDSPSVQGQAFEKTLQYAKAQEACQQAVSLNPNDIRCSIEVGGHRRENGK